MRTYRRYLAACLLLSLAACESPAPSAPQDGASGGFAPSSDVPLAAANANCRYTTGGPGNPPVSTVSVPVGGAGLTLFPVTIADCDGAWGFLTQSAVRVEFNNGGNPCTDFAQEEGGGAHLFKLWRCTSGPALLQIYTNGSKTTLLQSIQIDPIP